MRMAVEVANPAPKARPGPMRVVREEQPNLGSGGVLSGYARALDRCLGPGQAQHAVGVVIASDQPLDALQAREDFATACPAGARGEVA